MFEFLRLGKRKSPGEKPRQTELEIFKIGELDDKEDTIFWNLINPETRMKYVQTSFHPENGHKVESYGSGRSYNVFEFLDYRVLVGAINKCLESKLVVPHITVVPENAKMAAEYTQGAMDIKALCEFGLFQLADPNKAFLEKTKYILEQVRELTSSLKKVYPQAKLVIQSDHFVNRDEYSSDQGFIEQIMFKRRLWEVKANPGIYAGYITTLNDLKRSNPDLYFITQGENYFNPGELSMAIGAIEQKISPKEDKQTKI